MVHCNQNGREKKKKDVRFDLGVRFDPQTPTHSPNLSHRTGGSHEHLRPKMGLRTSEGGSRRNRFVFTNSAERMNVS